MLWRSSSGRVLDAVDEADQATAARVRASLRARHEMDRAELLGA
jgi:hypothetical protein